MDSITLPRTECNNNVASKKWDAKIAEAIEMGRRMRSVGYDKRGAQIMACGQQIDYKLCPECGQYEVVNTSLCRDRFCPLCNWRLALKRYAEMMRVMDYMLPEIQAGHTVGMLTLTIRNVSLLGLAEALDDMAVAYKRMTQRVIWGRAIQGYARNLEITHNDDDNTYHPHYHVLVICREGVDPADAILTISKAWGESLRASYTPICHGAAAYANCGGEIVRGDVTRAVLECSKYATKPDVIRSISDDDLAQYATILSGRQLVTYGGDIASARRALGITDSGSDRDIAGTTLRIPVVCDCGADYQAMAAHWAGGRQWEDMAI